MDEVPVGDPMTMEPPLSERGRDGEAPRMICDDVCDDESLLAGEEEGEGAMMDDASERI